jgi:hypothetical protein
MMMIIIIIKITMARAPNSSILNKPHPPTLILARQPVFKHPVPTTPTKTTSAIHAAPALVTDELTPSK